MLGSAAGTIPLFNCTQRTQEDSHPNLKIEKVKMAMLSMQRYAWEQGVAAQALLELGEKDLVILLAKDAVLRQWPDGRLAVVSSNHGVTDPAANGEAVLFAAQQTGDT